jgi:hypothetical protein
MACEDTNIVNYVSNCSLQSLSIVHPRFSELPVYCADFIIFTTERSRVRLSCRNNVDFIRIFVVVLTEFRYGKSDEFPLNDEFTQLPSSVYYNSQFTFAHTLVPTVTYSLSLLCYGLKRWAFLFPWVPERSSVTAISV